MIDNGKHHATKVNSLYMSLNLNSDVYNLSVVVLIVRYPSFTIMMNGERDEMYCLWF